MSRSIFVTAVISALVYILAPWLVKAFSNEPEILSIAVNYIRLIVIIYPLVSFTMTSGRIMQGLGMGMPMLVTSTIRVLGVSVPLALIFNYVFNKPIEWMWYAMMMSTVIATVTAALWLRYALKRRMISL